MLCALILFMVLSCYNYLLASEMEINYPTIPNLAESLPENRSSVTSLTIMRVHIKISSNSWVRIKTNSFCFDLMLSTICVVG